jgi:hypothetical protein
MAANPRDYFLEAVQTALDTMTGWTVLRTFNPTETLPQPYVFADLGVQEQRENTDESGRQVQEEVQEILILCGFTIDAQDTASEGKLSQESNKRIYEIQQAFYGILNTLEPYDDAFCSIFVSKIRIVRVLDGYDNQSLFGQALINAEMVYTIYYKNQ